MRKSYWCPSCGYAKSWTIRRGHRKCKQCRKEWSPGNNYPVSGFRINEKMWQRIIGSYLRERSILACLETGNPSYATAWRMVMRIKETMTKDVPDAFSGTCEVDATFVGGAFSNEHIHIRKRGSKRGRGTSKQAIFGVFCRETSQVRVFLVPKEKRTYVIPIIEVLVTKGSRIFSDGFSGYRVLGRLGYEHAFVDHHAGEYVRGDVHTQNLDGFWGRLKNRFAIRDGIRKRYLPLFIGEEVWRFNFRHLSREEQTERILRFLK